MKILEPGHQYQLDIFDKEDKNVRFGWLMFMKRIGEGYPGNTGAPHSGTNCQEVLRVLIDRVKYLNDVNIPDLRNKIILSNLRAALLQFEMRAYERHGYDKTYPDLWRKLFVEEIETLPTCSKCGHIICLDLTHGRMYV